MTWDRLPSVSVLALGGTIASTGAGAGVTPTLTAEQLVESVPGLADVARIEADTFRQVPSPELTLVDLVALAREIEKRIDGGDIGVVVTQGTNTIEETAFALDLLVASDAPVVVTGAMRNPTLPGADGPANLLAAVSTAASRQARGLGTLVVFADEIHAARYVRKAHTQRIMPFRSSPIGPIGWISENAARIGARPAGRRHLRLADISEAPPVALLTFGSGDEGLLAKAVAPAGYRALVVEATGGGHVTERSVEELERLAGLMPVVLASRTGSRELLSRTYSFVGSEVDLAERGLINGRAMTAARARMLLRLLLAADATIEDARQAFDALGAPGTTADLLGGRLTVTA
ncbi:MAG: asparaginase [Solirubrobacterales bacterium]|nr:asparaginase [Solirubrobacterales bacterium]